MGASVCIGARRINLLKNVKNESKKKSGYCHIVQCDLKNEKDCKNLVDQCIEAFGNNPKLMKLAKNMFDVNYWANIHLTNYSFKYLVKSSTKNSKSQICVISSVCGLVGSPGRSFYCSTKHALEGFFQSMQLESLNNTYPIDITICNPSYVLAENYMKIEHNVKSIKELKLQNFWFTTVDDVTEHIIHAVKERKMRDLITFLAQIGIVTKSFSLYISHLIVNFFATFPVKKK